MKYFFLFLIILMGSIMIGIPKTASAVTCDGGGGWSTHYECPEYNQYNSYISSCASNEYFWTTSHTVFCGSTNADSPYYGGNCSTDCTAPVVCAEDAGQSCNSPANNCSVYNTGTINCDGTCSASAPSNVTGIGVSCTSVANNCSATNSGTYVCNATGTGTVCSASAPADVSGLGGACNRNACGGTGVLQCNSAGTGSTCSASAPSCDTTNPTGTISANPVSLTVGATVTITMTGSDSGGVAWLLWNDTYSGGPQWFSCGGQASCSNSWTFTPPTTGNYVFTGTIYDVAGNTLGKTSDTVVVSAVPCTGTPNLTVTPNPAMLGTDSSVALSVSGLSNCQGKPVTFYHDGTPIIGSTMTSYCTNDATTSCAIGFSLGGISTATTISLNAIIDKNSSGGTDAGENSNFVNLSISSCPKITTRKQDTVSVPLAGGGICTVTIEHLGRDASDVGNVSYETLALDLNGAFPDSQKIGMDDDPTSGCQNNIQFTNEWTPGTGTLLVESTRNAYNASHDLEYGYNLTVGNNCAISSSAKVEYNDAGESFSSRNDVIRKTFEAVQSLWLPNISSFTDTYTIVPDNAPTITKVGTFGTVPDKEWHTSNPTVNVNFQDDIGLNNGFYKVGLAGEWVSIFSNVAGTSYVANLPISIPEGIHTVYFKSDDDAGNLRGADDSISLVVKKDTVAPTIIVGEIKRTSPDIKVITNNWLKEGVYEISISVIDPNGVNGSNVDTSSRPITIRSAGQDGAFDPLDDPTPDDRVFSPSLVTYNKFNVWVGPPKNLDGTLSLNDCVDEQLKQCKVVITVRDNAGNDIAYPFYLNVDYTAPSAQ